MLGGDQVAAERVTGFWRGRKVTIISPGLKTTRRACCSGKILHRGRNFRTSQCRRRRLAGHEYAPRRSACSGTARAVQAERIFVVLERERTIPTLDAGHVVQGPWSTP